MLSSQETSVSNSLQIVQRPQQSSIKVLSHFTCLREMNTATPHEGRLGCLKVFIYGPRSNPGYSSASRTAISRFYVKGESKAWKTGIQR